MWEDVGMNRGIGMMKMGINTTLGLRSCEMEWMNSPRVGVKWSIIEITTPPGNVSGLFSLVLSNLGVD
jgi:hypothetical protein